jgi:hypothetical protein
MQPPRWVVTGSLVLLLGLTPWLAPAARASHLAVQVTVEGQPRQTRAETDTMPPPYGKRPRPLLRVRRDQPVRFRWSVRNTDRRKKVEKLLIHLFLVRQARAGQKEVPDPQKGAVWGTAFGTALDPGCETHGQATIPINEPGTYLLRVESGFTEQDHEHFAAIDLQVE